MNEFIAKKLGEVLAFAEVGYETLERGRGTLIDVFGPDDVSRITEENLALGERIKILAEVAGVSADLTKYTEGRKKIFTQMRDLYLGGNWGNQVELLEWFGFFEGGALVHWNVILAIAEKLAPGAEINKDELKKLAEEGIGFHRTLLEKANHHLHEIAKTKI